jgi:hypothetical protein
VLQALQARACDLVMPDVHALTGWLDQVLRQLRRSRSHQRAGAHFLCFS